MDAQSVVQEMFFSFLECDSGTKGEQIAELILKECSLMELDMTLCRGQGYDGAGNMAGVCNGTAKLIQSKFPKAIYFHCASHKLNLCVARL